MKSWDAAPEPPPSNEELWRRYHAKKRGERESAYLRSLAGRSRSGGGVGASVSGSSQSGCEAAKRQRQSTFDALGTNRSFEASRTMDNMVANACK